jgi:hypothetical protein
MPDQATLTTAETQQRAMARQDSHGTPYARTKREAMAERDALAATADLGARSVHVGTWLGASGDCYDLGVDSRDDGLRIHVHRWHSTGETEVRLIFGSWWRPRPGRGGVEHARVLIRPTNAGYAVYESGVRVAMLKTETGALRRAVRTVLASRPDAS